MEQANDSTAQAVAVVVLLHAMDAATVQAVQQFAAVYLAITGDDHLKVLCQLAALPAGYLMDGIDAVGQIPGLSKAILIANEMISLVLVGGLIAACGLQVDDEFSTGFQDLIPVGVFGVLDDLNAAQLDLLQDGQGDAVLLQGIVFRLCAHSIEGGVQGISLRGSDLTDRPVVAAGILTGNKLAVFIGGIGVHQLVALVDAIDCTGQNRITLSSASDGIHLGDGGRPLLQDVGKMLFGDGVPFDGSRLGFGDYIAVRGVHFLQHIAGAQGNILEHSHALAVGDGVFVHGMAVQCGTMEAEGHAFHQTIFGFLDDTQLATLQGVVEGNLRSLATDDSDLLGFLDFINVHIVAHFGDGIGSGLQIIQQDLTICIGGDGLLQAVAGDREGNACHITVFGGLHDLQAAVANLDLERTADGIADGLGVGNNILDTAAVTVIAVRPGDDALTGGVVLGCGDGHGLGQRIGRSDGQLAAAGGNLEIVITCRKRKLSENTVLVRQDSFIGLAVPFQFHSLAAEAGDGGVVLDAGDDAVVVVEDLLTERVILGNCLLHRITAGRDGDVLEAGVTLTHHSLPNQDLGCDEVGHLVGVGCLVGAPVQADLAGIAVLQDPANERLDGCAVDGGIQLIGIIVPVILATAGVDVAGILVDAGFDAVADRAGIGTHCTDDGSRCCIGIPAVHVVQFSVTPVAIGIVVAFTGICDEVDVGLVTSRRNGGGCDPQEQGQAHGHRQKQRQASLEVVGFHGLFLLSGIKNRRSLLAASFVHCSLYLLFR